MKITTGQLRQIIREELLKKKSLNEAIKLPKNIYISALGGGKYAFERQELAFEASISQAKKISDDLIKTLNGLKDKLKITSMKKEASVYLRDGDVAIGIIFNSNLNPNDMVELIDGDGGIGYRR